MDAKSECRHLGRCEDPRKDGLSFGLNRFREEAALIGGDLADSEWIFAAKYKSLKNFIRRYGEINSCAAELSRLGRIQTQTR
jgi:hypothetical protein